MSDNDRDVSVNTGSIDATGYNFLSLRTSLTKNISQTFTTINIESFLIVIFQNSHPEDLQENHQNASCPNWILKLINVDDWISFILNFIYLQERMFFDLVIGDIHLVAEEQVELGQCG